MILPIWHPLMYREASTLNSGLFPARYVMGYFLQILSSRFILKHKNRLDELTVFDLYYGCEMQLTWEDRSSSGHQIGEALTWKPFEFIDEEQRLALCVFFQPSQTFLFLLETDLENGKLILHQLLDLNVAGETNILPVAKIYLDRQGISSKCSDKIHRIFIQFLDVRLDRPDRVFTRRRIDHNPVFNNRTYKEFQLKFSKESAVPQIVNQRNVDQLSYSPVVTIINQKAYTNVKLYPPHDGRRTNLKPNELIVIDLSLPRDANGEYPEKIMQIQNFEEKYISRPLWRFMPKNSLYYYIYKDTPNCVEIVIIDMENLVCLGSASFNCGPSSQLENLFVDDYVLILQCVEDYEKMPDNVKVSSMSMFPIGRPLLLVKLAFFEVRRLYSKHPKCDQLMETLDVFSCLKPPKRFVKCESIQDAEFQKFCSNTH